MQKFLQQSSPADIAQGVNVAYGYENGKLVGWDKAIAKDAFNIFGDEDKQRITKSVDHLPIKGNGKIFLYQFTRKVLGQDTVNYPQQVGDCVSFGAKNCTEYVTCTEKAINGEREIFKNIFPPYFYGTGRVYVGGGRMGYEDGSVGGWMATAVTKYGVLNNDYEGVPQYSGSVARAYGAPDGAKYLDKWKPYASQHPIKSAAFITSWDQALKAITNGYPISVCSDQGFTMSPDSSGFHRPSGNWGHCMTVIGIDDDYQRPYVIILNSWGDVMGRLTSFYDSNEKIPIGCLRVEKSVFVDMLGQQDSYAYSDYDGLPEKDIDKALFKIFGE